MDASAFRQYNQSPLKLTCIFIINPEVSRKGTSTLTPSRHRCCSTQSNSWAEGCQLGYPLRYQLSKVLLKQVWYLQSRICNGKNDSELLEFFLHVMVNYWPLHWAAAPAVSTLCFWKLFVNASHCGHLIPATCRFIRWFLIIKFQSSKLMILQPLLPCLHRGILNVTRLQTELQHPFWLIFPQQTTRYQPIYSTLFLLTRLIYIIVKSQIYIPMINWFCSTLLLSYLSSFSLSLFPWLLSL